MTDPIKPDDDLGALAKQFFDSGAMKNNSDKGSGPFTIIGLYIYVTPNQNIAEAFCSAAKKLNEAYEMKKAHEAKRVLYNAAYNRSMN